MAYWYPITMVLSHEAREREEMRRYAAQALAGLYQGEPSASPHPGGRAEALRRLEAFDAARYNEKHAAVLDAYTSRLSPYIRHGLLSLPEVRNAVVARFGAGVAQGFVMQLLWRVFWHLYEPERRARFPGDQGVSEGGELPSATEEQLFCIDESLRQLRETGFIPYTARLWVASYLLHFRKIDWRAGTRLFQRHLLDADGVVNSLSWRWVLGEITGQPYFFTREAVKRHTNGEYCARCTAYRCPFQGRVDSVEERARRAGVIGP